MSAPSLIRPFAVAVLALVLAGTAAAQQKEAFSQERFEALQAENALVLVDVWAEWCGTCARQSEIIQAFRTEHPEVPLHVLTVDFDAQKRYVRRFRAPRQSTLILFRGEEQVWFSVAETKREAIFAAVHAAARPAEAGR
jgi:thioredoxin 1